MSFSEDVLARFDAYGWHTPRWRTATTSRPSAPPSTPPRLTTGRASSPSAPTSASAARTSRTPRRRMAHRWDPDEVRLTKEAYGWDPDRTFFVPEEAGALFLRAVDQGRAAVAGWDAAFDAYARCLPSRGRGAPASPGRQPRRRLGRRTPALGARHRGGNPERERRHDQRPGGGCAGAVRRVRRPVRVQPHRRQGRRGLLRRRRRAQPPLWRPRARDGRDRQRDRLPRRPPARTPPPS